VERVVLWGEGRGRGVVGGARGPGSTTKPRDCQISLAKEGEGSNAS